MKPRLQEKYVTEIRSALAESHAGQNVHAIPRLQKIVVNMGVGKAIDDKKYLEMAVSALTEVTGQKPIITRARKSIAAFKLREGQAIGAKVTLRRQRMYEFLDRLIAVALPRVRDFRGISEKGFDGRGNYTFGVTEQIIFPEIDIDKVARINGMDITFVTTAETDKEAKSLLTELGLPFKKN